MTRKNKKKLFNCTLEVWGVEGGGPQTKEIMGIPKKPVTCLTTDLRML